MKRILCFIFLLVMTAPASGAEMTPQELVQNIELGLSKIDDLRFTYMLCYRPRGTDRSAMTTLIKSTYWYKKPGLGKEDSIYKYLPGHPKHHHFFKLDGDHYYSYEVLANGSVTKTIYPAQEWDASGATPAYLYVKIKERMANHIPASVEYNASINVYTLKFDAPDQATFEVLKESWLPSALTVWDEKNNAFVKILWANITINPGLPEDFFKVPNEDKATVRN